MSWPSQPDQTTYANNVEFNDYIDSQYDANGEVEILNACFQRSQILFDLDRATYNAGYLDFVAEQREEFKQLVIDEFPSLIAYNYDRFLNGYENPTQRFMILRDTWESLINFLFAFAVGEYRCLSIRLPVKVHTSGSTSKLVLYGYKLFDKLEALQVLIDHSVSNGLGLQCSRIVPSNSVAAMSRLNNDRNEFSHSSVASEAQASEVIRDTESQVLDLLHDLRGLRDVHLLRYTGASGGITNLQHELFVGAGTPKRNRVISVAPALIPQIYRYLNPDNILVEVGGHIISLRPYIHYQILPTKHHTVLCFYKDGKPHSPSGEWEYETLGESGRIKFQISTFAIEINEIQALQ